MKTKAKIMVINHVDIDTILGAAVHLKLLGDAPAFHFKITGCTTTQDLEARTPTTQTMIHGYDSEGLDLSINIKDIKHIYGGNT